MGHSWITVSNYTKVAQGLCEIDWMSPLGTIIAVASLSHCVLCRRRKAHSSSQLTGHGARVAAKFGVVFVRAVPAVFVKVTLLHCYRTEEVTTKHLAWGILCSYEGGIAE